jgi:asparagine synthase (glutamine-hydrolysing)
VCGICGELTFDGAPVRPETLVAMRDRLEHRGPDDKGVLVSDDGRAGLGFRRLAIIDLSPLGSQPMANEDGAVRVAFNGEIYNFKSLRARLLAKGHLFRSQSDTEVLVHLYEEAGPKFVEEIDGMFAIAIWDRGRSAVCPRATGKEAALRLRTGRVVFGSEIKASSRTRREDRDGRAADRAAFHVQHAAPVDVLSRHHAGRSAGVVVIDEDGAQIAEFTLPDVSGKGRSSKHAPPRAAGPRAGDRRRLAAARQRACRSARF